MVCFAPGNNFFVIKGQKQAIHASSKQDNNRI